MDPPRRLVRGLDLDRGRQLRDPGRERLARLAGWHDRHFGFGLALRDGWLPRERQRRAGATRPRSRVGSRGRTPGSVGGQRKSGFRQPGRPHPRRDPLGSRPVSLQRARFHRRVAFPGGAQLLQSAGRQLVAHGQPLCARSRYRGIDHRTGGAVVRRLLPGRRHLGGRIDPSTRPGSLNLGFGQLPEPRSRVAGR